jgi:hypothetical protein
LRSSPTSIPEHLDHYGTFDAVRAAFRQFVENVPFYGFGVMCLDHPEVQALVSRIEDRRVITYGENPQSDVRYFNHRMDGPVSVFDVVINSRKTGETVELKDLQAADAGQAQCVERGCRDCGRHELGLTPEQIAKGLGSSAGSSAASPIPGPGTGSRSLTITATIRSRSRRCCRLRATPARAVSSPCTSRTAFPGFPACLTIFRPASTMPTR